MRDNKELWDEIAELRAARNAAEQRAESAEALVAQLTKERDATLRAERFHFYQMGLKAARTIVVEAHNKIGHSWHGYVSMAQDGARQTASKILKEIDEALSVGADVIDAARGAP